VVCGASRPSRRTGAENDRLRDRLAGGVVEVGVLLAAVDAGQRVGELVARDGDLGVDRSVVVDRDDPRRVVARTAVAFGEWAV
jgi:hypothetical protein